jgi:hypothetical protein
VLFRVFRGQKIRKTNELRAGNVFTFKEKEGGNFQNWGRVFAQELSNQLGAARILRADCDKNVIN